MKKEDIQHLANLSRLHLEESEMQEYAEQFDEIVAYVDKIKEVSGGVDHDIQSYEIKNMLRDDVVESYQNPEMIIAEAPSHQDNFVKVKKILN